MRKSVLRCMFKVTQKNPGKEERQAAKTEKVTHGEKRTKAVKKDGWSDKEKKE